MRRRSGLNPKTAERSYRRVNEPVTIQIGLPGWTGRTERLSRLIDGAVEAAGRAEEASWVGFLATYRTPLHPAEALRRFG
jgi:hypothetical protein